MSIGDPGDPTVTINIDVDYNGTPEVNRAIADINRLAAASNRMNNSMTQRNRLTRQATQSNNRLGQSTGLLGKNMSTAARRTDKYNNIMKRYNDNMKKGSKAVNGLFKFFAGFIGLLGKGFLVSIAASTAALIGARAAIVAIDFAAKVGRASVNLFMQGLAAGAAAATVAITTLAAAQREYQAASKSYQYRSNNVDTPTNQAEAALRALTTNRKLAVAGNEALTATFNAISTKTPLTGPLVKATEALGDFAATTGDFKNLSAGGEFLGSLVKAGSLTDDVVKSADKLGPKFQEGLDILKKEGKTSADAVIESLTSGTLAMAVGVDGMLDNMNMTLIGTVKSQFQILREEAADIGMTFLEPARVSAIEIGQTLRFGLIGLGASSATFGKNGLFDGIVTGVNKATFKIVELVDKYLPQTEGFVTRLRQFWASFTAGWGRFTKVWGTFVSKLRELQKAGSILIKFFSGPIGAIFSSFGSGLSKMSELVKSNEADLMKFSDKITNVFRSVGDFFGVMKEAFFDALPILSNIATVLNVIVKALSVIPKALKAVLGPAVGGITSLMLLAAGPTMLKAGGKAIGTQMTKNAKQMLPRPGGAGGSTPPGTPPGSRPPGTTSTGTMNVNARIVNVYGRTINQMGPSGRIPPTSPITGNGTRVPQNPTGWGNPNNPSGYSTPGSTMVPPSRGPAMPGAMTRFTGMSAGVGMGAGIGLMGLSALMNAFGAQKKTETGEYANKGLNAAQGAAAGAATGAMLGTMIMPGWGTAAGAVIGGGLGMFQAEAQQQKATRAASKDRLGRQYGVDFKKAVRAQNLERYQILKESVQADIRGREANLENLKVRQQKVYREKGMTEEYLQIGAQIEKQKEAIDATKEFTDVIGERYGKPLRKSIKNTQELARMTGMTEDEVRKTANRLGIDLTGKLKDVQKVVEQISQIDVYKSLKERGTGFFKNILTSGMEALNPIIEERKQRNAVDQAGIPLMQSLAAGTAEPADIAEYLVPALQYQLTLGKTRGEDPVKTLTTFMRNVGTPGGEMFQTGFQFEGLAGQWGAAGGFDITQQLVKSSLEAQTKSDVMSALARPENAGVNYSAEKITAFIDFMNGLDLAKGDLKAVEDRNASFAAAAMGGPVGLDPFSDTGGMAQTGLQAWVDENVLAPTKGAYSVMQTEAEKNAKALTDASANSSTNLGLMSTNASAAATSLNTMTGYVDEINAILNGKGKDTGDTASSRWQRTMMTHGSINGAIPGQRQITSGIRSYNLGSLSSDHTTGRAYDLVGDNLGAYASAIQASGGFAEFHGAAGTRHLHVVPGTGAMGDASTPASMPITGAMANETQNIYLTINPAGNASAQEIADAVMVRIDRAQRTARERA